MPLSREGVGYENSCLGLVSLEDGPAPLLEELQDDWLEEGVEAGNVRQYELCRLCLCLEE